MAGPLRPVAMRKDGEHLVIDWSDDRRYRLTWAELRRQCPCAACREEREKPPDPFHVLSAKELARTGPPQPAAMAPVGYYAYKVTWDDGHDTGIYTIEVLRELCETAGENLA